MPIPAGVAALSRSLLRDDVYVRLRDAIVDGTFTPGEQLRDGDLAQWLGVSRTPVREALLRLADDPVGSCEAAHDLACRHLAEVRAKISDLKAMARTLSTATPTVRPTVSSVGCARARD